MLVISSPAYAHSSVANDPAGDIATTVPAYHDIVKAKIHATGDEDGAHESIVFSMKLAEPIPQLSATTFFAVNWLLDTDANPALNYNVLVRWCSRGTHNRCQDLPTHAAHWEATINDFTNNPLTFYSTFAVEGDTVTFSLDPSVIGGAREFTWFAATRNAPGGTAPAVDSAPDAGVESFRR
jgi:hypothetical protein